METTEEIIKRIVSSFNAGNGGELYFNNSPVTSSDGSSSGRVDAISNLLYRNFYWNTNGSQSLTSPGISKIQQVEFQKQLREAYKTQVRYSKGWLMTDKDLNGVFYLKRKESVIRVAPGQFVYEYDESDADYKVSKHFTVLIPPSVNTKENYFYYLFGTTPDTGNEAPLVRFYFNIEPEGAIHLIKHITSSFNLFEIPFSFKCCQNPADYIRSDSAVLYLAYNYFNLAIQLLEKIIVAVKSFLKTDVPLFTLKLTNGFSFAENPYSKQSFGQSRCNIIAECIQDCVVSKVQKIDWVDFILNKIKSSGLDVNKMYLNPQSVYPYNFSLADFNGQ